MKSERTSLLRKFIITVVTLGVLVMLIASIQVAREEREALARAKEMVRELQAIRVGSSHYTEAQAIAERFGTARFEHHWGTRDCRDGYFEECVYQIPVRRSLVRRVVGSVPVVRDLIRPRWGGTAHVSVKNGTVVGCSFALNFLTSDGQWRGAGIREQTSLPEGPVQATVSDSYAVGRHDILGPHESGFALHAYVTPAATESERRRAWRFNLDCLERADCSEICEVQPDAWEDFYRLRGRFDVEKYGKSYQFCRAEPTSK